jgi:putative toxin-antitoxin system antitoxin component (TIGR02293 family)
MPMIHPVEDETAAGPDAFAHREDLRAGRLGPHWYVALVGLRSEDPIGIFKSVQKGLRYSALERLHKNSGLAMADLAEAVVISPRTLARRKEEGRLDPEESDRVLRLARIFGKALQLFEGDAAQARGWLSSPQRALAGQRPLALARTDLGAREVETLADRLEHGVLT